MIEDILSGEPRAARALLSLDARHWEELLHHVGAHPEQAAPADCVAALYEQEWQPGRWLEVAEEAYHAYAVAGVEAGDVGAWLLRGAAEHLDSPGARLEVAVLRLERRLELADPLGEGCAAVALARTAWGEGAARFPRLLLLFAELASEAGADDEAFAAALEAEQRLRKLEGASPAVIARARRLQEAARARLVP